MSNTWLFRESQVAREVAIMLRANFDECNAITIQDSVDEAALSTASQLAGASKEDICLVGAHCPVIAIDQLIVTRITQLGFEVSPETIYVQSAKRLSLTFSQEVLPHISLQSLYEQDLLYEQKSTQKQEIAELSIQTQNDKVIKTSYIFDGHQHKVSFSDGKAKYYINSFEGKIETVIETVMDEENWAKAWPLNFFYNSLEALEVRFHWAHPGSKKRTAIESAGWYMAQPIPIFQNQRQEMVEEILAASSWWADQLRNYAQWCQQENYVIDESNEQIQAFQIALENELFKKISNAGFSPGNPAFGRCNRQTTPYDPAIQAAANITGIQNIDQKLTKMAMWIDLGYVTIGSLGIGYQPTEVIYRKSTTAWQRLLLFVRFFIVCN